MSFMTGLEIAASGLSAARERMNVTASNLANAQTTRTAEGGPYRRRDVIQTAVLPASVAGRPFSGHLDAALRSTAITGVVADPTPPRMIHDPSHPDADARGFVAMPNISTVEEMVNMIMASRAYEAGVTTIRTVKQMAQRALQIGK